ncbi:hypothetical protein Q6322_30420, partial [Klebsiella pneumoniae]|uniref:hypothetical protein n=1 Tax=Klebsiella pneumoniae TaxID=573 RepID=UPI00273117BC
VHGATLEILIFFGELCKNKGKEQVSFVKCKSVLEDKREMTRYLLLVRSTSCCASKGSLFPPRLSAQHSSTGSLAVVLH